MTCTLSSESSVVRDAKVARVHEVNCKSLVQKSPSSSSSSPSASASASASSSAHSSFVPKSPFNCTVVVKVIVIIACTMLLTCTPVESARGRNYKNRNHRPTSSKKIKTKNSPIYYIKSNSFFNSRPLLTELLMNSHTSSAALSTLSNALSSSSSSSSSSTHYTRMSSLPSTSSLSSSYSSSSSSSSSASPSRPLVVSTMYRLPIKYLSNAKPTDVYKVSKKKNKDKLSSWLESSRYEVSSSSRAPSTSSPSTTTSSTTTSPTTSTTTTTTTTTTEAPQSSSAYPPPPVYFKERKKKRKNGLTESKLHYLPLKYVANGKPNMESLFDSMVKSGLFDSNGIKGGRKKGTKSSSDYGKQYSHSY